MHKCLLVLAIIPFFAFSQESKEVLFIGNSYTYTNNMPQMITDIALSFGDTLNYDSSLLGGATFNIHSTNSQTLNKISQQQWDYVVLQAQSQEPSFSPWQVSQDTYPYAEILVDSIYANSICTEPLFFMTWGRKYGDQQNCAAYPPICTYLGMQKRLRESYLEMAFYDSASCAPVGMAWKASIAIDSGETSLWESYLSLSRISLANASIVFSSPNIFKSSCRLFARTIGSATRKNLTSAFGKTTVPISRPSTTQFWSSAISLWIFTNVFLTIESALTALTFLVTLDRRISLDTSSPLR